MIELSVTEARETLSDTVNHVVYTGERVMLQKHGRTVAALVSIEDAELLAQLEDKIDLQRARAALAESKTKGTKSWDKVKRDLGL